MDAYDRVVQPIRAGRFGLVALGILVLASLCSREEGWKLLSGSSAYQPAENWWSRTLEAQRADLHLQPIQVMHRLQS